MTLNAVIKCLDKDELDVTLKLKLANTYNDDKIIKVLYCLVFYLVYSLIFSTFEIGAQIFICNFS